MSYSSLIGQVIPYSFTWVSGSTPTMYKTSAGYHSKRTSSPSLVLASIQYITELTLDAGAYLLEGISLANSAFHKR